ncbi:SAM-dependent methyltransferase [Candidatus Palauibacter sp.]|uniref:SAM-dependent methyltransferase n=1 Tax=Candidatus Palauibacter sp. TaxID=3101350 RepID=UPI003B527E02
MIYAADFEDAHERHWEDAEYLSAARRWANADQLYGFSAECGLKSLMQNLGMLVRPDGAPEERAHRVHIEELWNVFDQFAAQRGAGALLAQLPGGEPFSDWSHHNRYASRGNFDEAYVEPHRRAASEVRLMVQWAAQGGTP